MPKKKLGWLHVHPSVNAMISHQSILILLIASEYCCVIFFNSSHPPINLWIRCLDAVQVQEKTHGGLHLDSEFEIDLDRQPGTSKSSSVNKQFMCQSFEKLLMASIMAGCSRVYPFASVHDMFQPTGLYLENPPTPGWRRTSPSKTIPTPQSGLNLQRSEELHPQCFSKYQQKIEATLLLADIY